MDLPSEFDPVSAKCGSGVTTYTYVPGTLMMIGIDFTHKVTRVLSTLWRQPLTVDLCPISKSNFTNHFDKVENVYSSIQKEDRLITSHRDDGLGRQR